jgi:hypothetical protein
MPEITMPRLSDTMQEGTIARWLKKPGDQVNKGDILGEIETDKATMDLEAYDAGTLEQIPTRRSCRATPPPRKKSRRGSRCSDSRDRAQIVSRNQTTRLIWVGAGTTPCCAGERMVASSTQKRIFVSAHPSRSIPYEEGRRAQEYWHGNSLHQLRRVGCA